MSLAAAAYVVVKVVDHSVSFTLGFAHQYRYGSVWQYSNLGLYEILIILAFMFWSILVIILSFSLSSQIWKMIEDREIGVKTEGKGGVALDEWQSAKIVVLTLLFGTTTVISGYSIGEVTDQLITYLDQYSDDKTESDDKNTGVDDPSGTAAGQDMLYHFLTVASSYLLSFAIMLGGFIFAFTHAAVSEPAECPALDSVLPERQ